MNRKHPWFKVSYPRYLELYPEDETAMDLKYLEPHVINELELVRFYHIWAYRHGD